MISLFRTDSEDGRKKIAELTSRQIVFSGDLQNQVSAILEEIRKGGDRALLSYIRKFDCPSLKRASLKVGAGEIRAARNMVGKDFEATLKRLIRNIEEFHKEQHEKSWMLTRDNGALVGQIISPVESAGLYVPGGRSGETPLISSLIMNAVPARIAGVSRVIVTSPAQKNGNIDPHLLFAAQELGICEIYKAGSAWGIAALAFGTETINKVDLIAGPGNIYVTIAKKLLCGTVGIDMIAGPSEILIVADESANPEAIAADLLSQAEHDPLATAVLITPSIKVAHSAAAFLNKQLKNLDRNDIARESIEKNGAVFLVQDLEEAIFLANKVAPEHLELMVADPFSWLGKIKNAGAVFLGHYSPEPIGDYIAGPNHVLPTMGTARFASALEVGTFLKKTSLIYYSQQAFEQEAKWAADMAKLEGLTAHAKAVTVRLGSNSKRQHP